MSDSPRVSIQPLAHTEYRASDLPDLSTQRGPVSDSQQAYDGDHPVPLRLPSQILHARVKQLAHPVSQRATRRELRDSDDAILAKRRKRRFENASLRGNPHAVPPSRRDLYPGPPLEDVGVTFPVPPPRGFLSAPASGGLPTYSDPRSEDMGRFKCSLRGVRRAIRPLIRGGGRACEVIGAMERALEDWLEAGHVWTLSEGPQQDSPSRVIFAPLIADDAPAMPDSADLSITELSRSPANMILSVSDPLNRFLVHCTARYWDVVSFSKTSDGCRVTWLLRPLVPVRAAQASLQTPPTTDWDAASTETSSVAPSEAGSESDAGDLSDSGWTNLGAAGNHDRSASLQRIESRSSEEGDVESVGDADNESLADSFAELGLQDSQRSRSAGDRAEHFSRPSARSASPSPARRRRARPAHPRQLKLVSSVARRAWAPPRVRFLEYLND